MNPISACIENNHHPSEPCQYSYRGSSLFFHYPIILECRGYQIPDKKREGGRDMFIAQIWSFDNTITMKIHYHKNKMKSTKKIITKIKQIIGKNIVAQHAVKK